MPLSIKDHETEQLARELAKVTGETITEATKRALQDRLRRVGGARGSRRASLIAEMADIRRRWRSMPVLDDRTADDIVGYDEYGAPR